MPTTVGPNNPSAAVNTDRGAAYGNWSTPTNVYASDDARATVFVGTSGTDYLDVTGFGFSLPTDAVIVGILVEVERSEGNATHDIVDATIQLLDAGSPVGADKAAAGEWPTTDAYASYGGSADLWSYGSWTPAKINASTFGVRLAANGVVDGVPRIDHVRISVTYNPAISLTEALSLADALAMKMGKVLTESATLAEAFALKTGKVLTDAASLADAVSAVLVRTVSITEALTIVDALSLKLGKVISETATLADTAQALLVRLPSIQTHYAPRPLITLTIGAATKRYSTETLAVPAAGQVGVAQVGESQVGG